MKIMKKENNINNKICKECNYKMIILKINKLIIYSIQNQNNCQIIYFRKYNNKDKLFKFLIIYV